MIAPVLHPHRGSLTAAQLRALLPFTASSHVAAAPYNPNPRAPVLAPALAPVLAPVIAPVIASVSAFVPVPLTFHAMDAAAAATTDPDELEAIRLTKKIIGGYVTVLFKHDDGVDYLELIAQGMNFRPMSDTIWPFIGLMETMEQRRAAAFAARHRDVMLASSAELCRVPVPVRPSPTSASVSPKQRMSALGAMQRSMIMDQLTHGMGAPQARDARKMTDCMTQYQASQASHGTSTVVGNALRTIDTIKGVGWKRQWVSSMMFPVVLPKSEMIQLTQYGTPYPELRETALQNLRDTLIPSDVLVAIATNIKCRERSSLLQQAIASFHMM